MNRAVFITIGIVIILLTLGVWIYLMLFGTPKETGEVFTNLGFDLGQQQTTVAPPLSNQPLDTLVDTQSSEKLRQLTTRPVAGFAFATTTKNEPTIRYVEKGTGHVYEINLKIGEEKTLSVTTVPKVVKATFSPNKNTIAFVSYENYITKVFVGSFDRDQTVSGIDLEPGAENITFTENEELLYTIAKNGSTKGYKHNLFKQVRSEQFSFNYENIDISWGKGIDKTYITTKPAHTHKGYIYSIRNNILTPVIPALYGLTTFNNNTYTIASYVQQSSYISAAVDSKGSFSILPILTLKEKCTFDSYSDSHLWCAAPTEASDGAFIENWYKGIKTSQDHLWLVSITDGSAQLYGNLKKLSGRTLDVKDIQINTIGNALAFINKLDDTLWLFDLTK